MRHIFLGFCLCAIYNFGAGALASGEHAAFEQLAAIAARVEDQQGKSFLQQLSKSLRSAPDNERLNYVSSLCRTLETRLAEGVISPFRPAVRIAYEATADELIAILSHTDPFHKPDQWYKSKVNATLESHFKNTVSQNFLDPSAYVAPSGKFTQIQIELLRTECPKKLSSDCLTQKNMIKLTDRQVAVAERGVIERLVTAFVVLPLRNYAASVVKAESEKQISAVDSTGGTPEKVAPPERTQFSHGLFRAIQAQQRQLCWLFPLVSMASKTASASENPTCFSFNAKIAELHSSRSVTISGSAYADANHVAVSPWHIDGDVSFLIWEKLYLYKSFTYERNQRALSVWDHLCRHNCPSGSVDRESIIPLNANYGFGDLAESFNLAQLVCQSSSQSPPSGDIETARLRGLELTIAGMADSKQSLTVDGAERVAEFHFDGFGGTAPSNESITWWQPTLRTSIDSNGLSASTELEGQLHCVVTIRPLLASKWPTGSVSKQFDINRWVSQIPELGAREFVEQTADSLVAGPALDVSFFDKCLIAAESWHQANGELSAATLFDLRDLKAGLLLQLRLPDECKEVVRQQCAVLKSRGHTEFQRRYGRFFELAISRQQQGIQTPVCYQEHIRLQNLKMPQKREWTTDEWAIPLAAQIDSASRIPGSRELERIETKFARRMLTSALQTAYTSSRIAHKLSPSTEKLLDSRIEYAVDFANSLHPDDRYAIMVVATSLQWHAYHAFRASTLRLTKRAASAKQFQVSTFKGLLRIYAEKIELEKLPFSEAARSALNSSIEIVVADLSEMIENPTLPLLYYPRRVEHTDFVRNRVEKSLTGSAEKLNNLLAAVGAAWLSRQKELLSEGRGIASDLWGDRIAEQYKLEIRTALKAMLKDYVALTMGLSDVDFSNRQLFPLAQPSELNIIQKSTLGMLFEIHPACSKVTLVDVK